jgi:hypothetical protein
LTVGRPRAEGFTPVLGAVVVVAGVVVVVAVVFEPVVEALKAGTCGERNFSTIVPIEPRKPLTLEEAC